MILLASLLSSFWFIHMSGIPVAFKLPIKPFRCDVCLPVWVSIALFFCPAWVPELVCIAFGSGILAVPLRNFTLNILRKQNTNA